ncbi:MAG: NifB/NifX family molybdenum-iron cluster-binding protein [Candidatus Thorarchaeota archaeon]
MKRRILIPTEDSEGVSVASHFGRAPFFAVFDLDNDGSIVEKYVHPNAGEHSRGGRGHAHNNVLKFQPSAVIVHGMGPRGIASFQAQNIAVLKANSGLVSEIIDAYSKNALDELTEGCAEAHHK